MKKIFVIALFTFLTGSCGDNLSEFEPSKSQEIGKLTLTYKTEDAQTNLTSCQDQKRFSKLEGITVSESLIFDTYELQKLLQERCSSGERLVAYNLNHINLNNDTHLVKGNFQCLSTICD